METKDKRLFYVLIGDGVEDSDLNTFFYDTSRDLMWHEMILKLDPKTRFPQLLKTIGIFPSTSQAMRCGWDKDIPNGWSEHSFGKKGHEKLICIWKMLEKFVHQTLGEWYENTETKKKGKCIFIDPDKKFVTLQNKEETFDVPYEDIPKPWDWTTEEEMKKIKAVKIN